MSVALLGAVRLGAAEDLTPSPRETREISGIVFELSPQHEELAAALAPKIAALNEQPPAPAAPLNDSAATTSDAGSVLTSAVFRAQRAEYLESVATLIGLKAATPLQAESYDLVNFMAEDLETSMKGLASVSLDAQRVRRVLIWDRDDLIRRLRAGEIIEGFTLDPDGEHGVFNWNFGYFTPNRSKDRRNVTVKIDSQVRNQRLFIYGHVDPNSDELPGEKTPANNESASAKPTTAYAIVLNAEHAKLPLDERAEKLFANNIAGTRKMLEDYEQNTRITAIDGGSLALLLLRETARIGLIERLGTRPELKWVVEGAARYVTWRTLYDQVGPEAALSAYDQRARLSSAEPIRRNVSLTNWPKVGAQPTPESQQREEAQKTYSAMVFFVMSQRYGADSVTRFIAELSQTPPASRSAKTVEKAFKKVTGADLVRVFKDVVNADPRSKSSR